MSNTYILAANAIRTQRNSKRSALTMESLKARSEWDAAIRAALIEGIDPSSTAYAVASEVAARLETVRKDDGCPCSHIPKGEVRTLLLAAAAAGVLPRSKDAGGHPADIDCGACRVHCDGSGIARPSERAREAWEAAYLAWRALNTYKAATVVVDSL